MNDLKNCFFCQRDSDTDQAFSIRKMELPAVLEKYRNHGFVICKECWQRKERGDASFIAVALLSFARSEHVISN